MSERKTTTGNKLYEYLKDNELLNIKKIVNYWWYYEIIFDNWDSFCIGSYENSWVKELEDFFDTYYLPMDEIREFIRLLNENINWIEDSDLRD